MPLVFASEESYVVIFLVFLSATSWGLWIAVLSCDSTVATTMMPFFITVCERFDGVLRHCDRMPILWKYTMYYATPFTSWIGGVLTSVLGGMPVICNLENFKFFETTPGITCGEYAGSWLFQRGMGYLSDAEITGTRGCSPYDLGNDYLSSVGLEVSKTWIYFGVFLAFTVSNYAMVFLFVYIRSRGMNQLRRHC